MSDKTDYSPLVDEPAEAEKRRQGRFAKAFFLGFHSFWIYAVVLAAVIVLLLWLLGGFGEGGGDR